MPSAKLEISVASVVVIGLFADDGRQQQDSERSPSSIALRGVRGSVPKLKTTTPRSGMRQARGFG